MGEQEKKEQQDYILSILSSATVSVNTVAGLVIALSSFYLKQGGIGIIIASIVYITTFVIFILKFKKAFDPKFLAALLHSGIKGIYLNKNRDFKRIIRRLEQKTRSKEIKDVRIIAYYGRDLLTSIKEQLLKALNDIDDIGFKIRVIIVKPNTSTVSDFMDDVLRLECESDRSLSKDEEVKDCINNQKEALRIIKSLYERAKNTPGKFEYKFAKTQIRYSLIAVNDDWGWWTPYHSGLKVIHTTSFVVGNPNEPSILYQCKKHFDTLWDVLDYPKECQENVTSSKKPITTRKITPTKKPVASKKKPVTQKKTTPTKKKGASNAH